MNDLPKPRRTRADAVRNREQILRATVDLMVEQGPAVPLDMIARRAGVGIATLYRHFPDRMVLLRQVALDVLTQSTVAAKAALAEEPDAFTALARFLHDAIDLRIGVVMPMLAERVLMDEELVTARDASQDALSAVVRAAHDEGSLRPDVGSGDIGLLMIRMTPPLPVAISPEDNHQLSHRHLELVLDGLLRFLAVDSLPGRPLGLEELGDIPRDEDGNYLPVMEAGNSRCRQTIKQPDGIRNGTGAGNAGRSTTSGS
jgi:AcrR family transcriptional regulator